MGWIVFIKNISDTCQVMIDFITYIQRQFNALVLAVMTDNGGEYVQIDVYFKQQGIRHIRIPPYSHQSNGVPKRYNRTIQTMARGMLTHTTDKRLWAEACRTIPFSFGGIRILDHYRYTGIFRLLLQSLKNCRISALALCKSVHYLSENVTRLDFMNYW